MKKALSLLLASFMLLGLLAACGSENSDGGDGGLEDLRPSTTPSGDGTVAMPSPSDTETTDDDPDLDGVFFKERRQISVEVFDRETDPGSPANNNVYTDFLKEKALELHNIEITEYRAMPRHEEDSTIPLWLASGTAPDVCITYNYAAIQEYAGMGAVHDLEPLVHGYRDRLNHLWDLFGEYLIYYARDPANGHIWWMETYKADTSRLNTFMREDWLKTLNLAEPNTIQEFENVLIAFRDNAETLLPGNADKMIPFQVDSDPGWTTENMMMAFVPSDISMKDKYIYGFDDRKITWPGIKEGVRMLNKWYNDDLLWNDFALYGPGAKYADDVKQAGYVGAFMQSWNYPYRDNPSYQATLQQQVGPEASFIAIDPFQNDAGKKYKRLSDSNDRKIFFPTTNKEPKASIFYIDMLCRPDIITYLQLGKEGVNYELKDGVPTKILYEAGDPGWDEYIKYFINSHYNIDLLMSINELYEGGLTALAQATSYDVEPRLILKAVECAQNDALQTPYHNFGTIEAESGMMEVLKTKRNEMLNRSIKVPVAEFDSTFDAGMREYMETGGQAIQDERREKWEMYME
ncbi:MAG: sugar ABC transporter substrate-binding protein [Oscillospiraceae bacterium]|nr:sugar ABC transporter substrate-binding protein [Oscillospiraceae bacterium]